MPHIRKVRTTIVQADAHLAHHLTQKTSYAGFRRPLHRAVVKRLVTSAGVLQTHGKAATVRFRHLFVPAAMLVFDPTKSFGTLSVQSSTPLVKTKVGGGDVIKAAMVIRVMCFHAQGCRCLSKDH